MKKLVASLLFLSCLFCAISGLAQTVNCPSAGFSLTIPDTFIEIPHLPMDDPNLVLRYTDNAMDLAVYVSYAGSGSPFMVLTGNEVECATVNVSGTEMAYARGFDEYGPYATYSWMRAQDAVTLYFVWSGSDDAALRVINDIMYSITFN